MESARAATSDDLSVIVGLAQALRDEVEPTRGGDVWVRQSSASPSGADLAHMLGTPAAAIVVGLIDDVIVGYALVRIEILRDSTRLGVVDELFVEEAARVIGVGEAIADLIVNWSRDQGCFGVDASALPGNRAAKNFFETHGFVARMIVMHKALNH